MWVMIDATSDRKARSMGKTMTIEPEHFTVDVHKESWRGKGARIVITAQAAQTVGTGERFGIPVETRRILTVSLDEKDLAQLVQVAFKRKLLSSVPQLTKLRRLTSSLERLCKEIGLAAHNAGLVPKYRRTP